VPDVSYFAASLTELADGWTAVDLDLDAVESLEDLVDLAVDVHDSDDADPAATVVLVEQEDEWFAVVRADPDDPRVFVSDAPAALRHALGEILLPDLVPDVDLDSLDAAEPDTAEADHEPVGTEGPAAGADRALALAPAQAAATASRPAGLHDAAGDPDLLADLGVPAGRLQPLAGPDGPTPGEALSRLAELIGCADALESIR
jgi:putative tRNA adenosine deaminase-associated protein